MGQVLQELEAHVIQWRFVWQRGHKASQNLGEQIIQGPSNGEHGAQGLPIFRDTRPPIRPPIEMASRGRGHNAF